MKRLLGLMLFCIGLGMAIMIFLPINIWVVLLIIFMMIVGYNLFCSCK